MTFFSILKNNKFTLLTTIALVALFYLILNFQYKIFQVLYSSKIWAHRVNSIEKFQEAHDIYSGIELDLVFNSINNKFDVNHPPAKSINLSLIDFLKTKKNYSDFGIWLDFKNLNESNYQQSANKLDSIVKALNINPETIIVESPKPLFLESFSSKKFKTSYYLPSNINDYKKDSLLKQSQLIDKLTSTNKIDFISSDIKDYAFMKKSFPNSKILTWITNDPPKIKNYYSLKRSIIHFKRNYSALNDQDAEVILFRFDSKTKNR